ncbi:hypothetical protein FOL46_001195 [Perkinsus olseni]|uniref:Uncharacterized protein n=1 Tax=Perkinsus olseni TaxID=32597 RepID=A0A7J6MFN4_PEROL|nr:hypothetical protein FOL46_001195 [Perkinsus olseni]
MSTPRNAGMALTSRRYDPSVVAAILAETDKHLSSIGRSREYICGLRGASPPDCFIPASEFKLFFSEMAAIREETRKLAHTFAGISGIKSDAESVANLQTMVQDLRRKSEEVSSELWSDGGYPAVESSSLRNTKLKLRETNTTEETSRLLMEATRCIEDTLASRLSEKEREIAESAKEWQGKFETSQRLQFENLENRLNEISSELARCRSAADSSVKRVAAQLEHHNEDMIAEVTSRIDTLASAQSALSGKVETVDDKIREALSEVNGNFLERIETLKDEFASRLRKVTEEQKLRPLNAGRIEGSIQENAVHRSKIDGEIGGAVATLLPIGQGKIFSDPNRNLNYRAAAETNQAVDGQGVQPIDYERMMEDFYAHIEELRRSVGALVCAEVQGRSGAIVDRIQVTEAGGHRVQAKISEEDEKIGIKILLSEAESSEKITAIEGEVGNIRSILNEHDERLSEVEYRVAEREGRQDHSPGDFTKNQAEHFINRLSQSVAEEVREGRLLRGDFEELSGLTSPVIHNQQPEAFRPSRMMVAQLQAQQRQSGMRLLRDGQATA